MDKQAKTAQRLPFFLIDLMKSVLECEPDVEDKADVLLFEIGRQLVNKPTPDLEYLYDTTKWLQDEIISKR